MNPLKHPYRIPRNPYERELSGIDPIMYRSVSPTLLPVLPILKAIYQQTAPKEPEQTRPQEPPGEYMTTDEVAAYVKRSPNTIRKWFRENTFPYIVFDGKGRDRVFSKEMVDRWMEKSLQRSSTLTVPMPERVRIHRRFVKIQRRKRVVITDEVAHAQAP